MESGHVVARTWDSQLREPGFKSLKHGQFHSLHIASVYLAVQRVPGYRQWWIYVNEQFCAVIAAWLNASQKSRDAVGMNR